MTPRLPLVLVALATCLSPAFAQTLLNLTANGDILSSSVTVASTTQITGASFGSDKAFDNLVRGDSSDHGLLFNGSDNFLGNAQLLAITGFTPTTIGEIWIYTLTADSLRVSDTVTVKSSTSSTTSLSASTYETTLGTFSLGVSAFNNAASVTSGSTDTTYAILNVAAPAGTQSVFFDFGNDGHGMRIAELQAFSAIPEPSTYAAAAGALVLGGAVYFRRRNRQSV
jgi:hypothetical protein